MSPLDTSAWVRRGGPTKDDADPGQVDYGGEVLRTILPGTAMGQRILT